MGIRGKKTTEARKPEGREGKAEQRDCSGCRWWLPCRAHGHLLLLLLLLLPLPKALGLSLGLRRRRRVLLLLRLALLYLLRLLLLGPLRLLLQQLVLLLLLYGLAEWLSPWAALAPRSGVDEALGSNVVRRRSRRRSDDGFDYGVKMT